MKTLTPVLVAIGMVLFPAGLALAKDGSDDVKIGLQLGTSVSVERGGNDDSTKSGNSVRAKIEDGDSSSDDSTLRASGSASSNANVRGEDRSDDKDKIERSSSTSSDDNGRGREKGMNRFSAFFSWLFGLPATTTVGDIRANIVASTTATTSSSQGLGFWARIFGFFNFGNNRGDGTED